jgi:hypothetical protein
MFFGAKCMYCPLACDPTMAEAIAATHAVLFSKDVGFFDVIFEGNALQVTCKIQSAPPHASHFSHSVEIIQQKFVGFRSSCVVYTYRETNGVTHALAKQAISLGQNHV